MADTYETLLFHQRQAYHAWKSALDKAEVSLKSEADTAAWELFVLCADFLTEPTLEIEEEIAQVAYDLAVIVLESSGIRTLNSWFRDSLVEAVLTHIPESQRATYQMVRFVNLLSDAYSEAYTDRLHRKISQQRTSRLSEELHLAKQIQERLLPKSIPNLPGYQIAGKVVQASEVGGDYWSFKWYEEDGIGTMKLVDISGHGIAAATLVAAVKFISGGYYRGAKSAHEVIERTNKILVRETPVEVLVTMVYGWLHPDTNEVDIVNAGHEPVFVCKGDRCIDIMPTGPVLGVQETEYGERTVKLDEGDILLFCSDGITEAGIAEQFGVTRLKDLVLEYRDRTADELVDLVIQSVTDYAGQPHDDMSIVVVKKVP